MLVIIKFSAQAQGNTLNIIIQITIFTTHGAIHNAYRAVNPLPDDKILDWSKLKQTADNILKCI